MRTMAYHYNVKLQHLSPAEIAWWKEQLSQVVITENGHEYTNEDAVPEDEVIEFQGMRGLRNIQEWSGVPDDPSVEVNVRKDTIQIADNEDETSAGLEAAGHLLAQFYARFRAQDCLTFTFAFDEFEDEEHGEHRGGVVVVSRRGVRFPSMTEFAAAMRAEELAMLHAEMPTQTGDPQRPNQPANGPL